LSVSARSDEKKDNISPKRDPSVMTIFDLFKQCFQGGSGGWGQGVTLHGHKAGKDREKTRKEIPDPERH